MSVAATVALALSVAGCGGSGSSAAAFPGGARLMRVAYRTTLKHRSAKFRVTETIRASSTTGSSEATKFTGSGEGNFSSHEFGLTINSPSGGSVEVLRLGATLYMRVPPPQRSQIPGNKAWVSVNLNKVVQAKFGRSLQQLAAANNDNPTQALSHLSQVSDRVIKVGSATIDGVHTTEYRAQVDLNKVAARTKRKSGARAAQAIRQQEQALGTHLLPVEVWIGPHNLVRQITQQAPIPAASAGATNGSGTVRLTMDFYDYGTPVRLTPPPRDQVANITSQVVQQAKASSG